MTSREKELEESMKLLSPKAQKIARLLIAKGELDLWLKIAQGFISPTKEETDA